MALSIFTPSVTGMEAQSHALGTVATNIANMRTVGYKANQTMFYTLLGSQPVVKGNNVELSSSRVDVDGVGYYDRTNIDAQGTVTASSGNYDVALNGTGNAFFMLRDSSNKIYYTRAGDFGTRTEDGTTYLVSSGGLKVQGFPALEGGGFGASPDDIVIKYPEKSPSVPTSKVEVTANVPATGVDTSSYSITVYGPNNDGRTMNMLFSKVEGKVNTWKLSFNIDGGTVNAPDIEAVFDSSGQLLSPKTFDLTVNWDDGSSNQVAMDISHMTQYDGSSGITHVSQDGKQSGNFVRSYIGDDGIVKATYDNGVTINMAKLAVVGFEAPNNLSPFEGTLFEATPEAGDSRYMTDTKNLVVPQALEQSTVNAEIEFSNMIQVQRAYSLNTTSFTTANEMLELLVNLKT